MATAEEIISSLAMDEDRIITIDGDLRTIIIPESIKHIGVESDKDVLRLQFRMPKTYYDVDLSNFSVRINYMNANHGGDVYFVDDATVENDYITFSWLVGRFAVVYKGTVEFIVCLKKFDENDELDKEYNTTVAELTVLEGLETSKTVVAQNPDALENILLRLTTCEENQIEIDTTLSKSGYAADAKVTGNRFKEAVLRAQDAHTAAHEAQTTADLAKDLATSNEVRITAIEENGGGTGSINIDTTLSKSGYAADAKVTGDNITIAENRARDASEDAGKAQTTADAANTLAKSNEARITAIEENGAGEVYILNEGETLADAPNVAKLVIDLFN